MGKETCESEEKERWSDKKKKLLAIREIEGREKQKVGGGGRF